MVAVTLDGKSTYPRPQRLPNLSYCCLWTFAIGGGQVTDNSICREYRGHFACLHRCGLESIIWKSLFASQPDFGCGSQAVGSAPDDESFDTSLAGEIGVKSLSHLKSKRLSGLFWDGATRLLKEDRMRNFSIISIEIMPTPLTF